MEIDVAHIVMEPRPDGRWAGSATAPDVQHRSTDPQAQAEMPCEATAKGMRAEVVVKGTDGQNPPRDRYGGDTG